MSLNNTLPKNWWNEKHSWNPITGWIEFRQQSKDRNKNGTKKRR